MNRFEIRRRLVALALKNGQPGHGSAPHFFHQRTAMITVPDLTFLPMPWALVGAIALRAYAPERATADVDILVHQRDAQAAEAAFRAAGYAITARLTIGGFTAEQAGLPPIDVLTNGERWVETALAQPGRDAAGLPVVSRPYLALLKLRASRSRDLPDLTQLVGLASDDERAQIRAVVAKEAADMIDDYDSIAMLAHFEYGDLREGA